MKLDWIRWLLVAGPFLVAGVLVGVVLSGSDPCLAQSSDDGAATLLTTQSLILEHVEGTTVVVDEVLKVGNLPINRGLGVRDAFASFTGTAYYRGYLRFDLAPLTPNDVITQAEMIFNVDRFDYEYHGDPVDMKVQCGFYRVTDRWTSAPSWDWADNPDIVTDTAYHTTIPFGVSGTYTVDVTDLVQGWVDGQANYGVMLGMYPDLDGVADFTAVIHGPEAISETLRPRLNVLYSPRPSLVYLPVVMRRYPVAPDLVVESVRAVPDNIQVVVGNHGNAPTVEDFWVDAYIDPDLVPTEVNQLWPELADAGIAWGVAETLQPGSVLTLTVGDNYYDTGESVFSSSLAIGTSVYVQVDSWNPETAYGTVLEDHEMLAGPYVNNIGSTLVLTDGEVALSTIGRGFSLRGEGDLPPRE